MAKSTRGKQSRNGRARTVSASSVTRNGQSTSTEAAPTTSLAPVSGSAAAPARPQRKRLKQILIGIGIVALLLIVVGVVYAWWTVQRSLPTTSGSVKLEGMSAPATVTRDSYGVPHIVAANVEDLYEAQGYVHAQDRLFQMFYFRRLGAGRLAEAFGPAAQNADVFLRTLGMRRAAEADFQTISPDVKKALEAYSRGVNAFLHSHKDAMPLEFNLIGMGMDDWSPVDTIAFGKVMSYDLSGNWDQELITADLRAKIGNDRAAELYLGYPANAPVTVPGANTGSLTPLMQAFDRDVKPWLPSTGIAGLGSNNWVVDGTKSTTGKPLLSNDPHLSVQNPSIWYQVDLKTSDGKYDAAGFGFAGAPGIVTGHNQNVAWGVTNVEGDVQDFFIEKLDPQNHPNQYETPDGWQDLKVITETINVKGAEPITQTIRLTRHGPLMSDALTTMSSTLGSALKEPLALEWTALEPGHLFEAVYALQTVSNWQEFRAALQDWSVPGQNFVYADKNGNIGYQMTGLQPIRKKGDGTAPVPGWTGEYDWSGFVPFDDLPRTYNPPDHFVATANNKPFGSDYKYPIEGTFAPPWRITRIREMLTSKEKLSPDDFKTMLMDTHSILASEIAPILGNLHPTDAKAQEAVQLLGKWDANLTVDSPAASIYEVTLNRAFSDTLGDDLGQDLLVEYLGSSGSSVLAAFEGLVNKPGDPFWDDVTTLAKETRDGILTKSLTEAVGDLTGAYGDNTADWTWGKLHVIQPRHVFGSQPVISGVFNLPSLPYGGDGTTVSVGGYDLLSPYAMSSHQSYRMIIDTSDWSKSMSVFAGGESGQPFSKHWGDQFNDWQQGVFHPILYTQQDIDANNEAVLTLTP